MRDVLIALGMGGPDSISAIEPFLANMLSDRKLINFGLGEGLQNIIANFIASRRAKKLAPQYEKMGGRSPQLRLTEALFEKVSVKYAEKTSFGLDTYPAMCYWHPLIRHTAYQLAEKNRNAKHRRIILFPLYPQYSSVTTGICFNLIREAIAEIPPYSPVVEIYNYHLYKPYLELLAKRIHAGASKIGKQPKDVHILFSAHSLPKAIIDKGDPYVKQITEQCVKLVDMVKPKSFSLAYQSKFGRGKWLSPSVKDELVSLAHRGVRNVVVLALSFVSDNIETLIELDEDLLGEGEMLGLNIARAEMPNDSDDFVDAIVGLISEI